MAKKKAGAYPALFSRSINARHPRLFLAKYLEAAAEAPALTGSSLDNARIVLGKWADMAEKGQLGAKETSLDDQFLQKIFGEALGYKSNTDDPTGFHRIKAYNVKGAGTADGALGFFSTETQDTPVAVIELKGSDIDLDHDKSQGRTAVDQLWDYLNHLPGTPWGILSNYHTIRLYHRDRPKRAYEEFTYEDFRDEPRLKQFYCVFERNGLLGNKVSESRALKLLRDTGQREKEVGEELYKQYSEQRLHLIDHLIHHHQQTQDEAIHIAQKILDRVIFIAFCEDRGLLSEKTIEKTVRNIPPFSRATNPVWENFKNLFFAIDKGHARSGIPAYNGGLFANDPLVDSLDLDDSFTHFFDALGTYDFKDEVNLEVLGNLFERSVTELEKLRVVGLFGKQAAGGAAAPQMSKSAERKRFGVYYTPPDFTALIVERTVGRLIEERVDILPPEQRPDALKTLKVCDPACGSGAFLIAAFDRIADSYNLAARLIRRDGDHALADEIDAGHRRWILEHNLYGVDVSEQSVEITRLALWIKSAEKDKTLNDLTQHVVWGNSLVDDPAVHPKAFDWRSAFAAIFAGPSGGFDAVIGNPPWERVKLQEREFFALGDPAIASAVSAADRRKLIAELPKKNPDLQQRYQTAQASAEAISAHVRAANRFPLTAKGDVNLYMLFAELARTLVSPRGYAGLLVPSGVATDDTTKEFFQDLMEKQSLVSLFDFENHDRIFQDVDGRFKFSVLVMGGTKIKTQRADFVFFARSIPQLQDVWRHIELSQKDLKTLNPNTLTCPIFRSRTDAELTKSIYGRVPVLVDKTRKAGGDPWGIRFMTMFHQTNDAELFKDAAFLKGRGLTLDGNRWTGKGETWLPLYEAKMMQAYDHRAASVIVAGQNWMRQGQTEETTLVEHQKEELLAIPRCWVEEKEVHRVAGAGTFWLAYKDVTSPTNQRTMIASFIPEVGLMNSAPVIRVAPAITPRRLACLLANLNSVAYDFVARQKVGGLHLNFFIVEQVPAFPPDRYDDSCPWEKKTTLESWISDRVLRLTCTANDMIPLAKAAKFKPEVVKWKEDEREKLTAELDAAYFHLYGLTRDEVSYVLGTFNGVVKEDESHGGTGPTRKRILDAYDALA